MRVTRVSLPTGAATVDQRLDSDGGGNSDGMRQGLAHVGRGVIEKQKVVVSAVEDLGANAHIVRKAHDPSIRSRPTKLPPISHLQVRPRPPRDLPWP